MCQLPPSSSRPSYFFDTFLHLSHSMPPPLTTHTLHFVDAFPQRLQEGAADDVPEVAVRWPIRAVRLWLPTGVYAKFGANRKSANHRVDPAVFVIAGGSHEEDKAERLEEE